MATPDFAFVDGFDHYSEAGNGTNPMELLTQLMREWTGGSDALGGTAAPGHYAVPALSGPSSGCSLLMGSGAFSGTQYVAVLKKPLPANYARQIGGVTLSVGNNTGRATFMALMDGTTTQFSLGVNTSTGTISAFQGDSNGTVLGTSTETVPLNTTHLIEWDITIHSSAGIVKVWLDGAPVANLTLTGLNTRMSANNYFNTFAFGMSTTASGVSYTVDHLYLFNYVSSGGSETPLLNGPIVQTDWPSSDNSVQFAAGPSILGKDYRVSANTLSFGGLWLIPVIPDTSGSLNSVAFVPWDTNGSVKFKAVLYSDSSGAPGSLVATGTEVVGCTGGATTSLPFSSGQSLTAGTQYWIGFITDTSLNHYRFSNTTLTGQNKSNTYSSGAPSTAGTMTTGLLANHMWGNMTGSASRFSQVNKREPTLQEYNQDGTVGDKDLFGFPALTSAPTAISLVAIKLAAIKTDGGARTVSLDVKSGSSSSHGTSSSMNVGLAMGYATSNFWTDPATSAAWTTTGLNGAFAGYDIAS